MFFKRKISIMLLVTSASTKFEFQIGANVFQIENIGSTMTEFFMKFSRISRRLSSFNKHINLQYSNFGHFFYSPSNL